MTTELLDRLTEGSSAANTRPTRRTTCRGEQSLPTSRARTKTLRSGLSFDVPEEFFRGDNWQVWGGPTIDFHKRSDWFDLPERERLRDETEFNAAFRIVDTLAIRVGDKDTRSALLHFESQGRDFDERDR